MGRSLILYCKCGEVQEAFSSDFYSIFWQDMLYILDYLECSPEDGAFGYAHDKPMIPIREFSVWFDRLMNQLERFKTKLPVLYRIWRKRKEGISESDVGYFVWGQENFMVEAIWNELIAKKISYQTYKDRISYISYSPPVADTIHPSLRMKPHKIKEWKEFGEEFDINGDDFDLLFKSTDLSLERHHFLDFFSEELRRIRRTMEHSIMVCKFIGLNVI